MLIAPGHLHDAPAVAAATGTSVTGRIKKRTSSAIGTEILPILPLSRRFRSRREQT